MKEALKLFGAMLAVIVSVSAFHELRAAPAEDGTFVCQRRLCTSSEQCPCGACVANQCTTTFFTGN